MSSENNPSPVAASPPNSSKASGNKQRGGTKPRRSNSDTDQPQETPIVLQSIAATSSALLHPQVTLTCYIPTPSVGAVIGRRGSTILQIQRHAQSVGNGQPVRVSVIGHDDESPPYTYSSLDWSSPHWTPVVIRGDPCGALAAGQGLLDIVQEMDEVVLDLPVSRNKHASLIGKRGLILANLSADTGVRIMVPRKEVRHDVVQLEGDLEKVRICLERVLTLISTCRPTPTTVVVSQLPSQTKLRNVSRKTETTIRKKKLDNDEWQLLISGNSIDQIQTAASLLERWNSTSGGDGDSAELPSINNTNPRSYSRHNSNASSGSAARRGGRGVPRNSNNKGSRSNNKNTNKEQQTPPTAEASSTETA